MKLYSVLYRIVEIEDLALVMKSGDLPVLATPRMIAWMEEASCQLVQSEEGWTTVGISMDVSHDAPSALGGRIRIVSRLKEQQGKIYTFDVRAWCGETCIGSGTHRRAAVNAKRFMERLETLQ